MKKILFAASECVPFIKTGGLADVCGALPKTFDHKDCDSRIDLLGLGRVCCLGRKEAGMGLWVYLVGNILRECIFCRL